MLFVALDMIEALKDVYQSPENSERKSPTDALELPEIALPELAIERAQLQKRASEEETAQNFSRQDALSNKEILNAKKAFTVNPTVLMYKLKANHFLSPTKYFGKRVKNPLLPDPDDPIAPLPKSEVKSANRSSTKDRITTASSEALTHSKISAPAPSLNLVPKQSFR